jgi:hypothetical protein
MQHLLLVFLVLLGMGSLHRLARGLIWLSSLLCAVGVAGCGSPPPSPAKKIALEHVHEVCWNPPEVDPKDYFVFPDDDSVAVAVPESSLAALGLEIDRIGFIYKYSADAPAKNLRLLPLSRPEAWCTRTPKPTDEKVLRLLEVCPAPTSMEDGPSVTKNMFGQVEGVPYRSTIFCRQNPQMAPTTQQLILWRNNNVTFLEARDYAHKTAQLLTQAQAEAERVTNNESKWSLKRFFLGNPGSLEQIQQNLADALNSIEPPPEIDDPAFESIALAGYKEGFDNGQFEVQAKLFAIDAAIVLLEVVALEIAMGPLGGAKLLASAVSKGGKALAQAVKRLENIPIFIPAATAGGGAFIRAGEIIGSISAKAHRYRLTKALENSVFKFKKLLGEAAHHIVPLESQRKGAQRCRDLFAKFKLDIDAEYNGVFLPLYKKSPNPSGAIVHATLDNEIYYTKVARALEDAKSQADAIQILHRIRETLRNGTFYDAFL